MSKFRLDRLIEIKEKIMEEKEKEIQMTISAIDSITYNIHLIEDDITDNYTRMTQDTMSGNDFYQLKEYIIHLENKKAGLALEREELRAKMEVLKSELIEMLKEVKMLETLRLKALKVIKKAQNRKEQKMLDDMALKIERN